MTDPTPPSLQEPELGWKQQLALQPVPLTTAVGVLPPTDSASSAQRGEEAWPGPMVAASLQNLPRATPPPLRELAPCTARSHCQVSRYTPWSVCWEGGPWVGTVLGYSDLPGPPPPRGSLWLEGSSLRQLHPTPLGTYHSPEAEPGSLTCPVGQRTARAIGTTWTLTPMPAPTPPLPFPWAPSTREHAGFPGGTSELSQPLARRPPAHPGSLRGSPLCAGCHKLGHTRPPSMALARDETGAASMLIRAPREVRHTG